MVQQKFTTNFGEQIVRTTRYPGLSGGLDEYGLSPGPGEIGVIWFTLTLVSYTRLGMEAFRDSIKSLGDLGVQKLVYQPMDTELPARWCYARINHLRIEQRFDQHTDLFQPVEMIFQVISPYWETQGNRPSWDDTLQWDDTELWGGLPQVVTGPSTVYKTFSLSGSAISYPVIQIIPRPGEELTGITILKHGTPTDSIELNGTYTDSDPITINCFSSEVTIGGSPGYSTEFEVTHPQWMRLNVGDNLISFSVVNGGIADVYFLYPELWR